jgi:hypothetical protein
MPKSQQPVEGEMMIVEEIRRMNEPTVLDVGAGSGKWGYLLTDIAIVDAVEAWKPNVQAIPNGLYRMVYNTDIRCFNFIDHYDVIILGDVLEHLLYDEARELLELMRVGTDTIFLTIPVTECIQDGNVLGNPYETHKYQWSDKEVRAEGFKLLHVGANPNGLVAIGTYKWTR